MKLREQQRILILLKQLSHYLELTETPQLSPELIELYTDEELKEILCCLYSKDYSYKKLKNLERLELIHLLNSDFGILLWTISHLEAKMKNVFNNIQNEK